MDGLVQVQVANDSELVQEESEWRRIASAIMRVLSSEST